MITWMRARLFKGTVVPKDRSLMNVPFVTGDKDLDAKFVKEAKEAGFENLKGHRTVGGMRASIYNAMPIEGVEALVEFMKKFEKENAVICINIIVLNPIADIGLDNFTEDYAQLETAEGADAILVRSAAMHEMEFDKNLKAIAKSRSRCE